ncbi:MULTISPECIES: HNH endonuclease [unclassified Pseudomonas]|uniref:HNH endonuclease n=1 Tax=unclassified Pseudomonas TaxID=196821 RepID=UPI001C7ED511|nr:MULTISPECIES: HNH endonuclease [unclassified Pseudomonas]
MGLDSCPVCGDSSQKARDAMYCYALEVPGASVCGECAERIANAFSKRHGGVWLTWPNETAPKPKKVVINQSTRTQVFERDLYRCLRCGDHRNLRADHVYPESLGGEAVVENLQTLCASCNSWKGVKVIDFRKPAGA